MNTLYNFLFVVYPYVCLAVFLMGSLARFDRDQYTWKSDSSQLLRAKQLRFVRGVKPILIEQWPDLSLDHLLEPLFRVPGLQPMGGRHVAMADPELLSKASVSRYLVI